MLRVAVIGAGPSGLEAALACRERGWEVDVFERGDRPGHAIRAWGHVQMFTPWELNRSSRMEAILLDAGYDVPNGEAPTGSEFVERLIEPLCASEALEGRIHCGCEVTDISRVGLTKEREIASERRAAQPFRLTINDGGHERVVLADAVIDAAGARLGGAPLGQDGVRAPGERGLAERIVRSIPDLPSDAGRYAGKTTLLAGSGHSAQTAAVALAALARDHPGTSVLWVARSAEPAWGSPSDDPLIARAALAESAQWLVDGGAPAIECALGMQVRSLEAVGEQILVCIDGPGGEREVRVDNLVSLTGSRIDRSLYAELQVHECYATGGPIDLSAQLLADTGADCLTQATPGSDALRNPEPGFFIIGAKSYGRAPNYLMRTGFSQAEGVVGLIEADLTVPA